MTNLWPWQDRTARGVYVVTSIHIVSLSLLSLARWIEDELRNVEHTILPFDW